MRPGEPRDDEETRQLDRRGKIALGVGLLALWLLFETVVAHRSAPSAASPLVWAVLGTVAAGALGLALRCRLDVSRRRRVLRERGGLQP